MQDKSVEKVVEELSTIYNFDLSEALTRLELTNKNSHSSSKSKLVLPWTGKVCETTCKGLKLYHRLFVQCPNNQDKHSVYCKTCIKRGLKYGTVEDRLKVGELEYVDPTGIKVVPYANVMEKLGITKDEALREASLQNITIPEAQFEKHISKRGRPKKQIIQVSDTESETSQDTDHSHPQESVIKKIPKKRGRPKKQQKQVKVDIGDEIASNILKIDNSIVLKTQNVKVVKITIKHTDYLICMSNNKLYDISTQEEVGYWNSAIEQIEALDS
uniref:Uncharacterized protein n=1 Tax=Megaviridae environmental sample TaxID=1737588 RepID=A0A5J6VNE4_9VIRU|nr:MAG: hypothetical protein [Megaviridae environmental sample]